VAGDLNGDPNDVVPGGPATRSLVNRFIAGRSIAATGTDLGGLCGLIVRVWGSAASVSPVNRSVWAASVAAVRVSRPQKVCAPGQFHLVGDLTERGLDPRSVRIAKRNP
jgi:hypothetical protein